MAQQSLQSTIVGSMKNSPVEVARSQFAETFETSDTPTVALAPGRVNLIGEHTDYNDGFVLPMAIDRGVAVAFAQRNDGLLRAHSVDFGETRTAELSKLQLRGVSEWFDYVAAVVWVMRDEGMKPRGLDMVIAGDIPIGAGLSSSAAVEMAVARALNFASTEDWEPVRMATICQRAENEYVGVNCGIMDQFAASACEAGSALLLDCKTLGHSLVPIPSAATFVVMDTGVRRTLATSEYNARRASCEAAVERLRRSNPEVTSLRDVDARALSAAADSMDKTVLDRAMHVVNEIQRPPRMAEALIAADLDSAGMLMNESHASLRDLYEVSCDELDCITAIAREHNGCYGARMTGAGFGGCAIALVAHEHADRFVVDTAEAYSVEAEPTGTMYICRPSAGATIV